MTQGPRSDDARSPETTRSWSHIFDKRRNYPIFRINTQRWYPVTSWLCHMRVYLFDRSTYLRAHGTRPKWRQSRNSRIRSPRKREQNTSRLSDGKGSWCNTIISRSSWGWFFSSFYPTQFLWRQYKKYSSLRWVSTTLTLFYHQYGEVLWAAGRDTEKYARSYPSPQLRDNTSHQRCRYPYHTGTFGSCLDYNDSGLYPYDQPEAQRST